MPEDPSPVFLAIVQGVQHVLNEHCEDILAVIKESEKLKGNVAISATIDLSEPQPLVKVKMRYARTVTEECATRISDPNQELFHFARSDEFERPEEKEDDEG